LCLKITNNWRARYLETEEFSRLKEIIEITDRDLKTFDIVYTSDMLSIPRFNEGAMMIREGRAIAPDDKGKNVCVINYTLAEINNLNIGDKITVDLHNKLLMQHSEMGAMAVIPERLGETAQTAMLEIVGFYTDIDPKYMREQWVWWGYSPNTVFVPSTLLPLEVPAEHNVYPGEFSVVVDNPFDIKALYEQATPLVSGMGIHHKIRFSDKGWLAIADNVNMGQAMSLMTTAFFLLACAIAFTLAIYLYIAKEKKSFAVMRALGVPAKKARNALALPLIIMTAISVPLGGIIGTFYADNAVKSAVENLAEIAAEYVPDSSLPIHTLILCLLAVIILITFISALFLRRLSKTSILDLLQGNKKVKASKAKIDDSGNIKIITEFIMPPMPKLNAEPAALHIAGYTAKHIRRSKLKSVIAVVLAMLLTGACGLLNIIKLSYVEMFEQIEVKGILSNFSSSNITEAEKSALTDNLYYSGGFGVIVNGELGEAGYSLNVTNDFDRLVSEKSEAEYDVWYGDGYGEGLFNQGSIESRLIVIGSGLAGELGIAPSANVTLLSRERALIMRILGTTKCRARIMLAAEQIALCIFGIIVSAIALVIYHSELFFKSINTLLLCGGLYLCTCILSSATAAILITKRRALDLLQVKE